MLRAGTEKWMGGTAAKRLTREAKPYRPAPADSRAKRTAPAPSALRSPQARHMIAASQTRRVSERETSEQGGTGIFAFVHSLWRAVEKGDATEEEASTPEWTYDASRSLAPTQMPPFVMDIPPEPESSLIAYERERQARMVALKAGQQDRLLMFLCGLYVKPYSRSSLVALLHRHLEVMDIRLLEQNGLEWPSRWTHSNKFQRHVRAAIHRVIQLDDVGRMLLDQAIARGTRRDADLHAVASRMEQMKSSGPVATVSRAGGGILGWALGKNWLEWSEKAATVGGVGDLFLPFAERWRRKVAIPPAAAGPRLSDPAKVAPAPRRDPVPPPEMIAEVRTPAPALTAQPPVPASVPMALPERGYRPAAGERTMTRAEYKAAQSLARRQAGVERDVERAIERAALPSRTAPAGTNASTPRPNRPAPSARTPSRLQADPDIAAMVERGIVEEPTHQGPPSRKRRRQVPKTGMADAAWDAFKPLRDEHARKLGLEKGDVHHAIERQVLDSYPGVFSVGEINAFEKMRGVPLERAGKKQLHNSKIREVLDRHYREIDAEIDRLALKPQTEKYNEVVRAGVEHALKEIDYLYGPFFSESRTGRISR